MAEVWYDEIVKVRTNYILITLRIDDSTMTLPARSRSRALVPSTTGRGGMNRAMTEAEA